jgi:rubrerythrin
MVTTAGTQDNYNDLISSLLNLENDALEAYDAVIDRLEDASLTTQVSEFRQDHYRHVSELSELASQNGIEIPDGTAKSMLTSGKIVLADLFGDNTVLKAMRTNEEDTVSAYENALEQDCCTGTLREICTRAHADEVRHREWMESISHRKAA